MRRQWMKPKRRKTRVYKFWLDEKVVPVLIEPMALRCNTKPKQKVNYFGNPSKNRSTINN